MLQAAFAHTHLPAVHTYMQLLLQRTLRATDNLMQLCIHGGTIKYADIAQVRLKYVRIAQVCLLGSEIAGVH